MTLRIDDRLAQMASEMAAAQGKTLEEFVSEILQRALTGVRYSRRNGLSIVQVPDGTAAIDPGQVRRQLEEDGF